MIKKTTKQCKTTDRTPPPSVELDSLQTACCRHTAARDCQQANQGQTAVQGTVNRPVKDRLLCKGLSTGQSRTDCCKGLSTGQSRTDCCKGLSTGQSRTDCCKGLSTGQSRTDCCKGLSTGQSRTDCCARDCQQASQGQTAVRDCQQASQGQTAARDCQQANQVHITASPAVDCHTRLFPGGQPLRHATPTAHTQTHGFCHYSQNWVC